MGVSEESISRDISDFLEEKLQFSDPAIVLNCIFKVYTDIKVEYKLARCSQCKYYKNAGTKCRTQHCPKKNSTQECKKCNGRFLKIGNHNCMKDRNTKTKYKQDTNTIIDSIDLNTEYKEDTNRIISLENNTIGFELF